MGSLWLLGKSLKPVNMSALLWRGFFGSLSILAYFIALQTTTVAKGTLLNYTTTLWATAPGTVEVPDVRTDQVVYTSRVGTEIRNSPTFNIPLLYVAVAGGPGIVRVAAPYEQVD